MKVKVTTLENPSREQYHITGPREAVSNKVLELGRDAMKLGLKKSSSFISDNERIYTIYF